MATKKAAAKTNKAAKKVVAKKATVKKINPEFERAVRTAAWGTIGFCALEAIWRILANGFDWVAFSIVVVMALAGLGLKFAHDKGNQRLVDGLSALEAILVLVIHGVDMVANKTIPFLGGFGDEFVTTGIVIANFVLLALLVAFLVVHFLCGFKDGKSAIYLNSRINYYILLVSGAAMALWIALYGTTQSVALVEILCYYGMVIFVTDLVQRLEEGK